uniref:Auxin-responsive protein n=1 Tax=Noccaea caerulescens TaxID=107243 RepID=A0A1J3IR81_NOCCA
MKNGFRDVCSSSGSVMIGVTAHEDDNAAALSEEDSSCPNESVSGTELDLALGLSIGLNSHRNYSKVRSSSSSSSSSSLTRESGTKRSADSSAAASNATRQVAVGWPPLRTYRINSLVNQAKSLATEDGLSSDIQKDTTTRNVVVAAKNDDAGFIQSVRIPMLVKVTMDGVIIGRKVDLSALDTYEALTKTLEHMFFQTPSSVTRTDTQQGCKTLKETLASELLDGSSEYIITYQDKDGDWMLVGDVPWQMFLGSVKRLRIMRTSSETRIGANDGTER